MLAQKRHHLRPEPPASLHHEGDKLHVRYQENSATMFDVLSSIGRRIEIDILMGDLPISIESQDFYASAMPSGYLQNTRIEMAEIRSEVVQFAPRIRRIPLADTFTQRNAS